nr:CpsD/CapB family tyrosine-protein kinase [Anaerotalea alkaliphila]
MIRTNLEFTNVEKTNKTIVVTSAKTQEGKSTTTANLAITIANSGKKVLVIDGDMRKPKMHHMYDLPNDRGLSTVIAKKDPLEEVVHRIPDVEGLSVLVSGPVPPMPAELLGSKRMSRLLEEVSQGYTCSSTPHPC